MLNGICIPGFDRRLMPAIYGYNIRLRALNAADVNYNYRNVDLEDTSEGVRGVIGRAGLQVGLQVCRQVSRGQTPPRRRWLGRCGTAAR